MSRDIELVNIASSLVRMGIEKFIPDVCEGQTHKQCREECFHLAHDYLIDNHNYEPPLNEEIAVAVAERMFPECDDDMY